MAEPESKVEMPKHKSISALLDITFKKTSYLRKNFRVE